MVKLGEASIEKFGKGYAEAQQNRFNGLRRLVIFGTVAMCFSIFELSILISHSVEEGIHGDGMYSNEYERYLTEYSWKLDAGDWAIFFLSCFYTYYARTQPPKQILWFVGKVAGFFKDIAVFGQQSNPGKEVLLGELEGDSHSNLQSKVDNVDAKNKQQAEKVGIDVKSYESAYVLQVNSDM
mmetsp:Transcript_11504/g.15918  ORF Transcript_11504/g.15918 Transcript_11504/m.15918 type:complete len:182 (+) Transcript_11504:161-706(+)